MIISGTTPIVVNGKPTRVLGRDFNRPLRRGDVDVRLPSGERVVPSKGLSWRQVASAVRQGKKVQAKAA